MKEGFEFNILRTRSLLERILTICIFTTFLIIVFYLGGFALDYANELIIQVLFVGLFIIMERYYDKLIRGKKIGRGRLTDNEIMFNDKNFIFSDIKMLWVHYGVNTITTDKYSEYKFSHFETINIIIVNNNDQHFKFHIDNIISENERLSDYIESLRKTKYFFHIHFHPTYRFSRKEYQKTLTRYKLIKSSLGRRKTKR